MGAVEFYWASVAGADPEPVEVTKLDGRRVAYTCGCGDPFYLDEPDCPVKLGGLQWSFATGSSAGWLLDFESVDAMARPQIPNKEEADRLAEKHEREKADARPRHSWRGPR